MCERRWKRSSILHRTEQAELGASILRDLSPSAPIRAWERAKGAVRSSEVTTNPKNIATIKVDCCGWERGPTCCLFLYSAVGDSKPRGRDAQSDAAAAAVAAAAAGAVDAEVTRRRDVHRPADGLRFHRTVRKTRRAPRRGRERVRARPAWTPGAGGGCNQPSGLPRLTRGRRFHDRS